VESADVRAFEWVYPLQHSGVAAMDEVVAMDGAASVHVQQV